MFTRASDVDVLDMLGSSFSDFTTMYESADASVEQMWCFFKELVSRCIAQFVPKKRKTVRSCNPWLTKDLVRLGRKLKKARDKHKRHPTNANAEKIAELRVMLGNGIKKAKDHFQNVQLKNFLLSCPAKFWRYLSPKKKSVPRLSIGDTVLDDNFEIAKTLNTYFCSVFTQDNGNTPNISLFEEILPIDDVSVSEDGVLAMLLKLDIKKSPGIDEIPNAFLVRYAEWCAKYLTLLFRKSLTRAELPDDWRFAKITPIPKADDHSSPSSYRPISILCTSVKLLEHIIFKHISSFIESNNLLDHRQHGFRRGVSTVTQLIVTIHDIAMALDRHNQVDIIFLDFEKAFDRVSHSKLVLKLKPILKNDRLLAWIAAYLSSRRQCVVIDGIASSSASVASGVPQGSVLGPLFFLLFINDIVQDVGVQIRLFADDCVIYQEISSPNDQVLLNEALSTIANWCSTWQMTINSRKTVAMTITRKKQPLEFTYYMNNQPLSIVHSYKYLGVMITSDLRWNEHVTFITKKAFRKLGYLRRTLGHSTTEIKLLAYKTFIRPILEYAAAAWDPWTEANKLKLESIQRKSIRFIFNCYSWKVSPSNLLQKAELEKLETRRYHDRLKLFYSLYHNMLRIDQSAFIAPAISRFTRSLHPKKVSELKCRTNAFMYSFFPRTIVDWNALSPDVVERPNIDLFLQAIRN